MKIKFSHNYPKFHGQKSATLLVVEKCILSKLPDKFIEYDTVYEDGHYHLAPGVYMILVFLGDEFIPFTTVRPWTEEKYRYYHSNIGNIFDVEIE